jgi:hypothetical protein
MVLHNNLEIIGSVYCNVVKIRNVLDIYAFYYHNIGIANVRSTVISVHILCFDLNLLGFLVFCTVGLQTQLIGCGLHQIT